MLNGLGRHLVDESTEILARLEALEAGLSGFREGPVVGSLRLAAFSTAVRGLVAPALRELWKGHPGLEVTVLEHDPHDAIEQVATGSTDLALVHNWGDLPLPFPAHLDVEQIGTDTADVLLHRGHRLAGAALLTPQDLADEDWVCAPEGRSATVGSPTCSTSRDFGLAFDTGRWSSPPRSGSSSTA